MAVVLLLMQGTFLDCSHFSDVLHPVPLGKKLKCQFNYCYSPGHFVITVLVLRLVLELLLQSSNG